MSKRSGPFLEGIDHSNPDARHHHTLRANGIKVRDRDRSLALAIRIVGTTRLMAAALGISPSRVATWAITPPEFVLAIEAATEYRVRRHELRPDIYPPEEYARSEQSAA